MSNLILPSHLAGHGAPRSGASLSVRDPDPPESVLRELKAENPRWSLKFSRFPKPHWDVCEKWLLGDPKRQRIFDGTIPPDADFDVLCYCPEDIRADEVVGYIRRRLTRVVDPVKDAQRQVDDLERANAAVHQAARDRLRREIEHQHSRMTPHDARVLAGAEAAHTMIQVPKDTSDTSQTKEST